MAELQGSPWDQAVAVTAVAVSKQGPPGAGGVQEQGPRAVWLAAGPARRANQWGGSEGYLPVHMSSHSNNPYISNLN